VKHTATKSGIVVVTDKPQSQPHCPNPQPFEIRNPDDREKAIQGLELLWEAMQLGRGNYIDNGGGDGRAVWEARYRTYTFLGGMILGSDCPEGEIWT
jgi:hypothetical protein